MPESEQLSFAAEQHFLVRDETGQADRVDGRIAADQLRGRGSGTGGSVLLRLVVQLDDLGAR